MRFYLVALILVLATSCAPRQTGTGEVNITYAASKADLQAAIIQAGSVLSPGFGYGYFVPVVVGESALSMRSSELPSAFKPQPNWEVVATWSLFNSGPNQTAVSLTVSANNPIFGDIDGVARAWLKRLDAKFSRSNPQ
jgi:hypothetical protein